MTPAEAIQLADRLLQRHLETALTNFQDSLTAKGTDQEVLAEMLSEYEMELTAWKKRSMANIEQKICKCYPTVH